MHASTCCAAHQLPNHDPIVATLLIPLFTLPHVAAAHVSVWGVLQVAVKVIDLSDAPQATRQALLREAAVVLRVSGECHHTCQYKGATIKNNRFCLVIKRYVLLALAAAAGRSVSGCTVSWHQTRLK
jgi:hypothetical protein